MTSRHLCQHHRPLDDLKLPPLSRHGDDIQSIIHRIKSADIFRHLRHKCSEKVRRDTVVGESGPASGCVSTKMCPVSDTGFCCCRNTRSAACCPAATTGKHQAAACQCVCEFFFIPTLSPVMVTDWNWLMLLCTEKPPNKRGVWF